MSREAAGKGHCGGATIGEEKQVSVVLQVLKKTGARAKE